MLYHIRKIGSTELLISTKAVKLSKDESKAKAWKTAEKAQAALVKLKEKGEDIQGLEIITGENLSDGQDEKPRAPKGPKVAKNSKPWNENREMPEKPWPEYLKEDIKSEKEQEAHIWKEVNSKCAKCSNGCKQSWLATIMFCPQFRKASC